MPYVGGTWWELELADGWQTEDHAECLTLSRSNEGAFQLSAAAKKVGAVLPREIEEQLRQSALNGALACPFSAGVFSGLSVSYRELGVHWQRLWLAHGNLLARRRFIDENIKWNFDAPDWARARLMETGASVLIEAEISRGKPVK